MKKFIKKNWFKIILTLFLIIPFAYYLVVFLPQEEQLKIDRQRQEQIANEKKEQSDNLFEKKIECEEYQNKIVKKIDQYNKTQKPEYRDSNNSGFGEPMINLYVEQNELKEIFYSPKVNSCVYLESRKTLAKQGADARADVGIWDVIYDTYFLIDILNHKEINFNNGLNFLQVIHRGEEFNLQKEIDAVISKYK